MGILKGLFRAQALWLGLLMPCACLEAQDQASSTAAPAAASASPAPDLARPEGPPPPSLQLGLGYPDLRLRYRLAGPIEIELKVALEQGEQAYGGRWYWRLFRRGPAGLLVGAEGGLLEYNSIDTLSGSGDYGEVFVGAEYGFLKNWTILADYGLAKIEVSSEGQSLAQQRWIINTAVYYALF